MAIIYSYPEIPDVQGGDLLLISDTGAPNKPTRSVDIDDLAAYIGTVVGVVQNLQSVLTVGNTYVSPDGHGTFTLNDITNNDGSITFVNADEGWGYFLNAEEGLFFTNGSGSQTGSTGIGLGYVSIGNSNYVGKINSINITADRTYTLPDASGTIALTSDIPASGPSGSGTANYTARWTDSSTLGIGALYDNGTNVGIGTTSPSEKLHVDGNAKVQGNIHLNDAFERYIYGANGSYIKFYDPSYGGIELGTNGGTQTVKVLGNLSATGNFSTSGSFSMSGDLSIGGGNRVQSAPSSNGITLYNGADASMIFQIKHPTVGHYIWLDKDSNELVRFSRDGNVGIGTTSPDYKLHVQGEAIYLAGASNQSQLLLTRIGQVNKEGAYIASNTSRQLDLGIWDNNSTPAGIKISAQNNNSSNSSLEFITGGTSRINVNGAGNVGIGTTSPSEKLEVVGTIKSNQVDAFAENIPSRIGRATGQHLSLYGNPTGNYLIGVGNKNTIIGRSGQGRIVFRNDGIQFSTEATQTRSDLFIEVINGYVGVGTSSPSQKLEVAGNILVRGSNDSADGLHLKDRTFVAFSDASSVVSRFRSSAAGIFQFQDGSYNTNIVLNTNGNSYLNGGNVGIGTTTPGAKLSVNGNVKIEGTNSLLFGGSATVPIWAISSNGSDLLIDDQASNIGSVLFNNNEGVALPRLTTIQINAISSPAQGLMAYNTTLNTICFYNGSSWQKVNSANM